MEVHFNSRAQICGSQIHNYLLEKSRVTSPGEKERNYHIFYQLCVAALPDKLRATLKLGNPQDYSYTAKTSIVVDGLDDAHEFHDVLKSLATVGITDAEAEDLFKVVGGLLHLSNVVFDADAADPDKCACSQSAASVSGFREAARLLGLPESSGEDERPSLTAALTIKLIETRSERVRSPLPCKGAVGARDSMAKAIYGRMFNALVQRVNRAIGGGIAGASTAVIGVLDIFGFEIFEFNSFEQLCINYCNEKLQQHFNIHVFKEEQKCYEAEGIDFGDVRAKRCCYCVAWRGAVLPCAVLFAVVCCCGLSITLRAMADQRRVVTPCLLPCLPSPSHTCTSVHVRGQQGCVGLD